MSEISFPFKTNRFHNLTANKIHKINHSNIIKLGILSFSSIHADENKTNRIYIITIITVRKIGFLSAGKGTILKSNLVIALLFLKLVLLLCM